MATTKTGRIECSSSEVGVNTSLTRDICIPQANVHRTAVTARSPLMSLVCLACILTCASRSSSTIRPATAPFRCDTARSSGNGPTALRSNLFQNMRRSSFHLLFSRRASIPAVRLAYGIPTFAQNLCATSSPILNPFVGLGSAMSPPGNLLHALRPEIELV